MGSVVNSKVLYFLCNTMNCGPVKLFKSGMKRVFFLSAVLCFFGVISCRPGLASNLNVDHWSAVDAADAPVHFAELKTAGLILNFYSPTCGPCIQEIPALNAYYRETQKRNMQMYMALEQNPSAHGLTPAADASPAQIRGLIRDRMKQDIARYKIEIPFVIMDSSFKVSTIAVGSPDGLITGTPETLLFRTNPLSLDYNFVGPISAAPDEKTAVKDVRFIFALKKLDELSSAQTAY